MSFPTDSADGGVGEVDQQQENDESELVRQLRVRIAELEQQQRMADSGSVASYDVLGQNGNAADESDVDDHQKQQKEFRKMLAKFEMELKDVKQLSMITKFELENHVLQTELKHQKLLIKIDEMQKEKQRMADQLAKQQSDQMELFVRFNALEQKHENDSEQKKTDQKGILDKIEELTQELKDSKLFNQALPSKFAVMENFVGVLKDRFGNELLKAVSWNIRANIAEVFSNPPKNCWNSEACHGDLAIMGGECLMVHYKKEGNDWRSLFAKCPLPNTNLGISYYEVKIMNMNCRIRIGFATKQLEFDKGVGDYSDSYSYTSNGKFWINGTEKESGPPGFIRGDVIGCGVNLATGQIIFTKNGQQLDTADLFVSPTDHLLFPCVTLWKCGDLIEANFGPDFKFKLAEV